MTVETTKFSQFASVDLSNTTNLLVGISSDSSGSNIQMTWPIIWTTATRPASPFAGVIGYNSSINDYEIYNGSSWVPVGSGATGTVSQVNTGTGLTGGPITTTGTLSFDAIAANSLWANTTGSSAVPSVTSLSVFLLSANNLSDLSDITTAVSNLGLTIGTNVEAWSAILDEIAAGTWIGANSITTLGTIAFGTWESTQIGVPYGGTNNTSFTAYSVICAGTTSTGAFQNVVGLGTSGQQLTSNGPGALPTWQASGAVTPAALTEINDTNVTLTLGGTPSTALLQATSITAGWAGQLSLTRGGTNASLTASNGGIFYSTASAAAILSGTATANEVLVSGASAAPSWSTLSALIDTLFGSTQGDILYRDSSLWKVLAPGTAGYVLTTGGASANPSWTAAGNTAISSINVQPFTSSGTYTPTSGMVYCTIELVGGGGGGGGCVASAVGNSAVGGGGGGGGYSRKTVTAATIGASQTVTIGAAGTAGANTGTNGGTGGTSSLGSIVTASGGTGGTGTAAYGTVIQVSGGAAGVGASGDFNIYGGDGGMSVSTAALMTCNPYGGSSYFGGQTAAPTINGAGNNGYTYGVGGSGAVATGSAGTAHAGGAGAKGFMVITEYIA